LVIPSNVFVYAISTRHKWDKYRKNSNNANTNSVHLTLVIWYGSSAASSSSYWSSTSTMSGSAVLARTLATNSAPRPHLPYSSDQNNHNHNDNNNENDDNNNNNNYYYYNNKAETFHTIWGHTVS
jgi:hypothetical protein